MEFKLKIRGGLVHSTEGLSRCQHQPVTYIKTWTWETQGRRAWEDCREGAELEGKLANNVLVSIKPGYFLQLFLWYYSLFVQYSFLLVIKLINVCFYKLSQVQSKTIAWLVFLRNTLQIRAKPFCLYILIVMFSAVYGILICISKITSICYVTISCQVLFVNICV